jgi:hypothetical protein
MPQLEFMDQRDETLIASCAIRTPEPVPVVGDRTDVYFTSEPGTCACLKVSGRRFFYDAKGTLVKVQLWCEEVG